MENDQGCVFLSRAPMKNKEVFTFDDDNVCGEIERNFPKFRPKCAKFCWFARSGNLKVQKAAMFTANVTPVRECESK